MTEIFKIELKNKGFSYPELYFETKDGAEAVINTFNSLVKKSVKLKWKCSVVQVLSKSDAYQELLSIIETIPTKE